ncbi:histidine kinase [Lutimonas halocynthiae]|uniref:sensor histidine kinase n=1 Tax=Lutimonas halocynthiae TaxID=1446477 RepID=UPI0025B5BDCA|nr:histidine kinase [Lutimonas halocynthiae]MDN3642946.1 histidine kinase [Lutimonas halocynthiae]
MDRIEKILNTKSISLYWKCQLLGWGTVSIYWAYVVYNRDGYGYFFTFLNYVLDIAIGIVLTHGYRFFALKFKWNTLSLRQLFVRIVPSIILLAVLYMEIVDLKWYSYWTIFGDKEVDLLESLKYWDPVLITGLRLMSIWILAYHLYHYYQKEIETAQQNAELSIIAKQAELDNLSEQLNPHFLFNSLNSIKSLVIENPKTARRAIDLLSDILRSSLYEKDASFISIKNELGLVKDYVELEKVRFEERLNMLITMDEALEGYMIPPLSIQLLVENAIKHGIDKRIQGGSIMLSIVEKDGQLIIVVQNPGQIVDHGAKTGIGIKNLTKRLLLQYNGEASFTLKNEAEDKVTATLIIPIRKK